MNNKKTKIQKQLDYLCSCKISEIYTIVRDKLTWDEFVKITDLIDVDAIPNDQFDIYGDLVYRKDNKKLRKKEIELEPNNIKELVKIRCQYDIKYYAKNFYVIVHQDLGLIKIPLRDIQNTALEMISGEDITKELKFLDPNDTEGWDYTTYKVNFKGNKHSLFKWGRQSGKCLCQTGTVTLKNINNNRQETITIGEFFVRLLFNKIVSKIKRFFFIK